MTYDQRPIDKQCENGDGPANFNGFGHVFCWQCYAQWIQEVCNAMDPKQISKGEQIGLPLDAEGDKIVK